MKYQEDILIEKIKERVEDPKRFVDMPDVINKSAFHTVPPPVPLDELEVAEKKLGFTLPSLLRSLYLQVGNGGFGPGYGLLGLNDKGARNYHMNLVDWYLECVNHIHPDYPSWPQQFLTICDWGDSITSIIDWEDPKNPVYRFNGDKYDEGPFEKVIKLETPSLQDWLENWLNDRPMFDVKP